jgi:tRNA1(Val) A37 N6-methylase TrmN6
MDKMLIKDDETLDDLQLRELFVIQKKDKFRFGVDAILLANFANVKSNATVIDLCSGTGIVPFVIHGKNNPSKIIGLEIQKEMVEMAQRSVRYNRLQNKIDFIKGDLKNIDMLKKLPKADVVTVNPPYKVYNSGIVNPNDKIAIARHEICCNLEDVILACRVLLKDNKRMYMVHRPDRLVDIFTLMRKHKIEPKRVRMVHPSVDKAPNIVLIEGQRDGGSFLKWEKPLFVYDDQGNYTEELTRIYERDK